MSEHFEKEGGIGQRQTVMLSATLSAGVEKLAGLTLNSPELVNMNDEEGTESSGAQQKQLVIPTTLKQSYIIVPAKLRLVSLAAFILWKSTVILLFPYLFLSICTTLAYLSLLFLRIFLLSTNFSWSSLSQSVILLETFSPFFKNFLLRSL